jgi:hypothetical protein
MSQDMHQRIMELHGLYVQLTGFEIRLDAGRDGDWFRWLKAGFTEDDLKIMVCHLRKAILHKSRNAGAMKFRNLIGNVDYFEEDLAEAKAAMRKPVVNQARASVLEASGRPADWKPMTDDRGQMTEKKPDAKPVSEVIEKQFEEFRKLKEGL